MISPQVVEELQVLKLNMKVGGTELEPLSVRLLCCRQAYVFHSLGPQRCWSTTKLHLIPQKHRQDCVESTIKVNKQDSH